MENFINNLQSEVVIRMISSWGEYITHYAPHTIKEKAAESGIVLTDEESIAIASEINDRIVFLTNGSKKIGASSNYKKAFFVETGIYYNALKESDRVITFRNPNALLMEAQERGINITIEEAQEIASYINSQVELHNNNLQNKNAR